MLGWAHDSPDPFEPFGGETTNPSWAAARAAVTLLATEGHGAVAVELPCVFGDATTVLQAAPPKRPRRPEPTSATMSSMP